jgi:hypothetical protein
MALSVSPRRRNLPNDPGNSSGPFAFAEAQLLGYWFIDL